MSSKPPLYYIYYRKLRRANNECTGRSVTTFFFNYYYLAIIHGFWLRAVLGCCFKRTAKNMLSFLKLYTHSLFAHMETTRRYQNMFVYTPAIYHPLSTGRVEAAFRLVSAALCFAMQKNKVTKETNKQKNNTWSIRMCK